MLTSSAFWALFLQFSYLLYKRETLLLGLQNLLLQPACNAQQRQQKAANTSLLESWGLLVCPRPIECSRLSNNINILAKKIARPRTGGHAPRGSPAPGWIRHWRWTACKHCFMTCNTISFVSQLIRKCFRRNFLDLLGDVCSLNMCFSLYVFWLLCCIMPCESSVRFYAPPGMSNNVLSCLATSRNLQIVHARFRRNLQNPQIVSRTTSALTATPRRRNALAASTASPRVFIYSFRVATIYVSTLSRQRSSSIML